MLTTKPSEPRVCCNCPRSFVPKFTSMQIACSLRCAASYARKERMAKEQEERAQDKQRKRALKRRSDWEHECRAIVQKIARLRDRHDGCISCHLPANWDGQWHGSHFRSHGACSALQFHLWNIHKACSCCNREKGGNIIDYRPRLIEKIGADRVDWLECQNGIFKPPIDYYIRFKRVMGKRLRRLERRVEQEKSE